MTKKELLDRNLFGEIFLITNEFERAEKLNEYSQRAKELRCYQEFNRLLKAFEKDFAKKEIINNLIEAPNIPIPNLDGGSFVCNEDGIIKKGEIVCYHPLIPTYIYNNKKTGKEKVELSFYKNKKWKSCIVDKKVISSAYRIVSLSDNGIEVTSENARGIVNYLNEVINKNIIAIPHGESVSELGWDGNNFIPYNGVSILDSTDDFKQIFDSFKEYGSYEEWLNTVMKVRKNKTVQIAMATTFASPLLEKVGVMPYIVNLWSSKSGSGKTVTCMIAMSSWGNPTNKGLQLSSDSTKNYYMKVASFLKNITMFCDEFQKLKGKGSLDDLIMVLANGKDKGRLNVDRRVEEECSWSNNFLFTNNDKLTKEKSGEQVYNRIIDIECNEDLVTDGKTIADVIKNNYGFAGKRYINYIVDYGFKRINDMVVDYSKQLCEKCSATEKQALCIATILVANKLSQQCIFRGEQELTIDDVKDFVNDKEEIQTWRKAYEYIINDFAENRKYFEEDGNSKFWGRKIIQNNEIWGYVVLKKNLVEELQKGNFEFDSIKKDWANNGIIEKNTQGKLFQHTSVYGQKGIYVTLSILEKYLST